ncbi:MAG TPA: MFS transporter [Thermoplasmata archaeon]|nr:MFS transporter [Thermoplasmata archaeon]
MTAAETAPPPEVTVSPFGELSESAAILILVAVFLAILMGAMDSLVVATVLTTIAGDLHQTNGVAFVVSAYLVSSTISIPIFSRLSDITSRRNVLVSGLVIFIAGSALAGLSQNLTELIVFRGVQGFGGGGVFPVAIAMVAVLFPPQTRARVTGILSAAAGIAIVLGPLVGSAIVSYTSWRWVFYINLPFGILALVVLLLEVGPLTPRTRGRYDLPGTVLLSAWVGALMVALVQVADAGWAWTNPIVLGLLALSAVTVALFLGWELRAPAPLVPLRLLRPRVIGAASGVTLFTGVVFSAYVTFLSLFVGGVLLHSPNGNSAAVRDIIYFLAIPLVLGAAVAGQLLTKVAYRALIAPGLLLASVAALFLTDFSASTPLWVLSHGFLLVGGLALPLIPLGFGLGISLSGVTIAVQNEAPADEVGAAIGLTRFLQSLGGAIGISLLTVFLTWRSNQLASSATGPAGVQDAIVTSYNEVFLLLAICIVIAFVCSLWFVGRMPRSPEEDPEHVGSESVAPTAPVRLADPADPH